MLEKIFKDDDYNPYPRSDIGKAGRDDFQDNQDYYDNFHTSKEFHVKRIIRGEQIRSETRKKAIKSGLMSTLIVTGGIAVFGGLARCIALDPIPLSAKIISTSLIGLFDYMGTAFIGLNSFLDLKNSLKALPRIDKDLEASHEMLERLGNAEEAENKKGGR